MSTTISRTAYNALVDDSGDLVSGSVWNKSAIANVLLDPIDAMFNGAVALDNVLTVGADIAESGTPGGGAFKIASSGTSASWGARQDTSHTLNLDWFNGSTWARRWALESTGAETVGFGLAESETPGTSAFKIASSNTSAMWALRQDTFHTLNLDWFNSASWASVFKVASTGNVTVVGTLTVAGHGTTGSAANAFLDSSTGLLSRSTSSRRYKTDIRQLQGSERLLKLRPITFRSRRRAGSVDDGRRRWIGLIAEDVAPHLPGLVTRDARGRPDAVQYDRLAVVLLDYVQQLERRVAALEAA